MEGATPAPRRQRPWIVLSLEDALLDTRPAILSVIHLLSGATPADVAVLEATGELDDPWDLARAAHPWIRAGRPKPLPPGGWRVIVNQCGFDTGDLHARADRLYAQREWRLEAGRIDVERLTKLAEVARIAVVTDRDREGWARAETCLRFPFEHVTTAEDALRPDPQALLRFGPTGHFVGKGPRDRATAEAARFVFHEIVGSPTALVDKIVARLSAPVPANAALPPPPEPPAGEPVTPPVEAAPAPTGRPVARPLRPVAPQPAPKPAP